VFVPAGATILFVLFCFDDDDSDNDDDGFDVAGGACSTPLFPLFI
jgi:hypothetical protein